MGRGAGFARGAGPHLGMQLVALCDTWEQKLQGGRHTVRCVTTYTDYDRVSGARHGRVILANYFHESTPLPAIKALQAGKHVMSETACFTLTGGVALIDSGWKRAAGSTCSRELPPTLFNQEMRRLHQQLGIVGTVRAGEYNHSMHPD